MDIDEFIAMTQEIISEDDFADYLPTLVIPQTQEIIVLEGEPEGENHEDAVHKWLSERISPEQDFLVAFKVTAEHFKVICRINGQQQERVCLATAA